jgi:hypothetical protein
MTGVKHDGEKPRWDLLPIEALEPVVEVLGLGARKYGDRNWAEVPDAPRRYFAATMRHLTAWMLGEKRDAESGQSHLAHAVCCLLFIMALERRQKRTKRPF